MVTVVTTLLSYYTIVKITVALGYSGDTLELQSISQVIATNANGNNQQDVSDLTVTELSTATKEKPYTDVKTFDIRTPSNWEVDDFKAVINKELYPLIEPAIRIEEELGINAVYLIAVGATETLWGKELAGKHNYFNWSTDGKYYYNFENIASFSDYSLKRYRDSFSQTSFYAKEDKITKEMITPQYITIPVVNSKYAINGDKTINTAWGNLVCELLDSLYDKHSNIETN